VVGVVVMVQRPLEAQVLLVVVEQAEARRTLRVREAQQPRVATLAVVEAANFTFVMTQLFAFTRVLEEAEAVEAQVLMGLAVERLVLVLVETAVLVA